MNRKYTILLMVVLAAALMLPSALTAQGLTSAAITGKVTDRSGQPLVGANVILVHNPTGTSYGTSTRDDGGYNLPNLRVGGPYTLTVSYVGFAKEEIRDIYLQLSQQQTFNVSLAEQAVQTGEVVVTAERTGILSPARTGAATNVLRTQIDRLPTISRNFQDYYKLSPYFTGVNSSAANRNNRYNNIQVDGANFNDMFGLGATGTPGGQSSVTPISLDAIEEFQIVLSPFDVRQAGFTGAGINAITRSGTNTLKGSAFFNTRNQDFAGVSPDDFEQKLASFTEKSYGLRLGGPIIENQLFFFGTVELARREAPFTRTFNQPAFGTNAYPAYLDSLNQITNFLKSNYGYETGSWTSIPQFDNSDKFFFRLDYNISESHKLTARWNYLNSLDDNSPSRFRGSSDVFSENARYKLVNKTNSIALQLSSVFGNWASNELIVGYNNQLDQPTYYGKAFPTVDITTTAAGGTLPTRLAVGSEEYRHQNELEQNVVEITDNFSMYMEEHTITVGAKIDLIKFRNLFIPDNFGWYQYSSVAAFLAGGPPSSYAFRYSATSNPKQEANWGFNQYSFYAQDEWTINPQLKLTGGVRVDIPVYTDKPNYNARFDSTFTANGYNLSTSEPPKTAFLISPRIGFNYALDEERSTQLRGGVGVFSGRYPAVWVSNQYSNTGVDFYTVYTPPSSFIADPYGQPKVASGLPTAEVDMTDPNFKPPSILRFDLAVDQKLPFDFIGSIEGIYSKTLNDIYYQNINLSGIKGYITGENRAQWEAVLPSGSYDRTTQLVDNAFTAVYYVTNTDQGYNANFIVQLQRPNAADGVYFNAAYTWGLAKDIGGTNSTTASSGWRYNPTTGDPNAPVLSYADADRRHRVFATVSYRFEWGVGGLATTAGLIYNGVSGRPFSYIVNGDVNADGRSDNDLAYIPKDQSDIILVTSSGVAAPQSDYDALFAYINSDSYLSEHKGQMAERNAARSPWSGEVDLRITQEIPTIMGQKLEIGFDVLNLMNLINKKWGWVKLASDTRLLTFYNIDPATGRARYRWTGLSDPNIPDNMLSRWSAQFSLRYTF